jgi:hypothetical protein
MHTHTNLALIHDLVCHEITILRCAATWKWLRNIGLYEGSVHESAHGLYLG